MQSNGSHLMQKLNWNINSQFSSKHFVQAESECFGIDIAFFEHLWWMLFKMLVLYLIGKYLSILMSANMHWNYLRVFVIMQTSGSFFSPHGGWIIDASFPLRHWCYKHNRTSVSARHFFLNKRNTALFF